MIYKRFTEKSAEEWRQIYKALQLMEFLVKHGSERVIDDARSHLSLLKMLKQFHFIDQNGKDQGLNVRNRSKELTDLLSDVERIRTERKKARASKGKYGGVEGGAGLGGSSMSSSGQYGGFGSEQAGYGGYSGGVFGDGGGFGGASADDYESTSRSRSERFDEYDEYDEGASAAPARRKQETTRTPGSVNRNKKQPEPPKPKEPEVDLFSFGDDDPAPAPATISNGKAAASSSAGDFGGFQAGGGDDDDFDDFQSAAPTTTSVAAPRAAAPSLGFIPPPASTSTPTAATSFAAPQPRPAGDFSNIFTTTSPAPSNTTTPALLSPTAAPMVSRPTPSGYQQAAPNYFTSVSTQSASTTPQPGTKSGSVTSPSGSFGGQAKPKASGDAFASLLSGSSLKSKSAVQGPGMSMQEMAKQKSAAGLWGAPASASAGGVKSPTPGFSGAGTPVSGQQAPSKTIGGGGGALDDLLG